MLVRDDASPRRKRILVIDDEDDVREVFRLTLGRKGYEVTTAASGAEAVQAAGAGHFDLAFLDIAMPGMDGVATLRELRTVAPDLPVVMITAFIDAALTPDERQDLVTDALELGARGCLRKPFGRDTILKTAEYFASA